MTATTETIKSSLTKRIVVYSAKWPFIYLLMGMSLLSLSYIDDYFPFIEMKNILTYTDKLGTTLMVIAAISFFYNLSVMACLRFERLLAAKHNVATLILASVRKALRIIFVLITINILIRLLAPPKFYMLLANNIINTILIGSVGWIALRILYTFEAIIYQKMVAMNRDDYVRIKALYTKIHIIRNIATVLIIALTFAAIFMSFNSVRNIGISILASAGFLTAIVGLASQKTLFSVFSGLQIALSQPIKIGDIVVIENTNGVIEEITFTYVTLKLSDKRRMLVPINYFIEKPFENWTREADSLYGSVPFFIDYLQPIEPLREALTDILKSSPHWDNKINKIEVVNISERAVELSIKLSANSGDELGALKAEVREKLLNFMRTHFADHFPKMRLDGQPS